MRDGHILCTYAQHSPTFVISSNRTVVRQDLRRSYNRHNMVSLCISYIYAQVCQVYRFVSVVSSEKPHPKYKQNKTKQIKLKHFPHSLCEFVCVFSAESTTKPKTTTPTPIVHTHTLSLPSKY